MSNMKMNYLRTIKMYKIKLFNYFNFEKDKITYLIWIDIEIEFIVSLYPDTCAKYFLIIHTNILILLYLTNLNNLFYNFH